VTDWRIEKSSANKSYTANDTGGARKRVPGVKDCSGRLEIKADGTCPLPLCEGECVALELHVDGSGENYYELAAVVEAIGLSVDVGRGSPIAYRVGFSGNGPIAAHGVLNKG
jgi:hypothetical protein